MSKLTGLFPMSVKPFWFGVYQMQYRHDPEPRYSFYGGGPWRMATFSVDEAAEQTKQSTSCYNGDYTGWRGLAKAPK